MKTNTDGSKRVCFRNNTYIVKLGIGPIPCFPPNTLEAFPKKLQAAMFDCKMQDGRTLSTLPKHARPTLEQKIRTIPLLELYGIR